MSRLLMLAILGLILDSTDALATDRVVVLSPHRKSIQDEYVPQFQRYYKEKFGTDVEVDWIDQGGTSNAVKYLIGKAGSNPEKTGIDVFWGGTGANFVDMTRRGLLTPYEISPDLRKGFPREVAGIQLSESRNHWHATVVSSFGIMFNRDILKIEKLPEPAKWGDLASEKFRDHVAQTDPRKSGTASTMNMIVVEAHGWDKGLAMLTRIAGNTRRFTQSSSDPVRMVAVGDVAASMVIDFYGLTQVAELGTDKVGFTLPAGETVIDPDPVAMVRGGSNRVAAGRFIDFLFTEAAQKMWLLPKGVAEGPVKSHLARLAVVPRAYDATEGRRLFAFNPFKAQGFMKMDLEKAGETRDAFNDLIGAVMVDLHEPLRKAWKNLVEAGLPQQQTQEFLQPLLTESEFKAASAGWSDEIFRNKTLNSWVAKAKARYETFAGMKFSH